MFDRLTLSWALFSAIITSLVGLRINLSVESRWIAPAAMFLMQLALLGLRSHSEPPTDPRSRRKLIFELTLVSQVCLKALGLDEKSPDLRVSLLHCSLDSGNCALHLGRR
jgi:hypothetical protein